MTSQGRILTGFSILFLLAGVGGGIFILKDKERIVDVSPELKVTENTEDIEEKEETEGQGLEELQEILEKTEELTAEVKILKDREEIKEKANQVKGIYVGTAHNVGYLKKLLDETQLNGIVIDVKEASGPLLSKYLKNLIQELQQKDAWVIARIVVFRDSSLIKAKPEWYLKTTTSDVLWQDGVGQYWLDPANPEVQDYIVAFSKTVIDYGFDELQFDYIRYPPGHPGQAERTVVIGDFFGKLSQELIDYQSSIVLSVDLFGYIATQFNSNEIGQRLVDAGKYFDYLSFMLYPSHFYGGFTAGQDEERELPALKYTYPEVTEYPYQVVLRSVLSAQDYLSWLGYEAEVRPWLQDFNLRADTERGVVYDAEKVKAQIQAAIDAGAAGWLLWDPLFTYTEEALK